MEELELSAELLASLNLSSNESLELLSRLMDARGEQKHFEFVVEGVMLTAVSIFGLAGNLVAIAVLSRPSMRGSFSTLLIGLSLFDLLYLAMGMAIFGLPALWPGYRMRVYPQLLPVSFGLGHIGRVGSVFVTTSVTVERYHAIVHPLKRFRGKRHLLTISILAAILYNLPKFMEFQTKTLNGTDITIVTGSTLRSDPAYITYYIFWSKFILVELIPYMIIIVLNTLIINKIYASRHFRRTCLSHSSRSAEGVRGLESEQTERQRREANLGTVLIAISTLFIVCQSVKIVPDLYEAAICRLSNEEHADSGIPKCPSNVFVAMCIDLSHLLLAVNSSANFVIYTWRGEKFRHVLKTTFGLNSSENRPRITESRHSVVTDINTQVRHQCQGIMADCEAANTIMMNNLERSVPKASSSSGNFRGMAKETSV